MDQVSVVPSGFAEVSSGHRASAVPKSYLSQSGPPQKDIDIGFLIAAMNGTPQPIQAPCSSVIAPHPQIHPFQGEPPESVSCRQEKPTGD